MVGAKPSSSTAGADPYQVDSAHSPGPTVAHCYLQHFLQPCSNWHAYVDRLCSSAPHRVSSTSSTCAPAPSQPEPPAPPAACGLVARMAARSCSLCSCHLDFLACAADAAGRASNDRPPCCCCCRCPELLPELLPRCLTATAAAPVPCSRCALVSNTCTRQHCCQFAVPHGQAPVQPHGRVTPKLKAVFHQRRTVL